MFCPNFDQKWKLALFPLAVSLNTWWGVLRLYVYLYTVHCTDQTEFIKDKHSSISLCCKTCWALCLEPALLSLLQKGDQLNFVKNTKIENMKIWIRIQLGNRAGTRRWHLCSRIFEHLFQIDKMSPAVCLEEMFKENKTQVHGSVDDGFEKVPCLVSP